MSESVKYALPGASASHRAIEAHEGGSNPAKGRSSRGVCTYALSLMVNISTEASPRTAEVVAGLAGDVAAGGGQAGGVELTPARRCAMATRVVTVNDILDGHVGLALECFDRIYLNG